MTAAQPVQYEQQLASQHFGAVLRLLDRPISPADLAAGAEWAARPVDARGGPTISLLLFRLGAETAALPATMLRRVTPFARPTPIPHRTSNLLRGLCNIRGELVLCADLHRLLGLPARAGAEAPSDAASDTRRMVVLGRTDASWVFEVDALIGIERAETTSFCSAPVTVEFAIAAFTTGVAQIKGERVTILDGERILAGFQAGLA